MNTHSLDAIFKPDRIAITGISPNPRSVSGQLLSNLVNGGFRGVLYPVSDTMEAVSGIPCVTSLNHLPRCPELAMVCNPAAEVVETVRQCGEAGIKGIIILSAGFGETGDNGRAMETELRNVIRQYDGMRVMGPNCLGIILPGNQFNASFASAMPKKGHIALISQSGALCTAVLDWALEAGIGFSCFASIGNTIDVDFGDLIDYFGEDEETESIILYVESIQAARKFMSAARAFARVKPIIVYKAGRFPESAEVSVSHTGAIATEDVIYDAAFQRTGLVRVSKIGEIFDCAELIGRKKLVRGPKLGIVTNAGGPGVMAADALIAANGSLGELSEETMNKLNDSLPSSWSHGNPVDVLGDARSKRLAKAVRFVIEDAGVDAVLVILTPQAMTNPTAAAREICKLSESYTKPILAAWMGGVSMREGIRLLTQAGVAAYSTPEQAVHAYMTLVDYSRNLESLYETPKDIAIRFPFDRQTIRGQFREAFKNEGRILSERASKELIGAYGIPGPKTYLAKDGEEAVQAAAQIGYPVVLKVQSPDIPHKTDAGGVMLDVPDGNAVGNAFRQILVNARAYAGEAEIDGVTVQPMIKNDGTELILGFKRDPVFGTVMMVGAGGITAEIMGDHAMGFPPLSERLASRMLESLKIWPLLHGFRGRPAVNLDKLIEVMIRLSYLAVDLPEIQELDINPLLITPDDVIALDARAVIDPVAETGEGSPYSHLAMRPYPEAYVKSAKLKDGRPITLRPIKPEDETMWFDLLRGCSRESIYMRFRYMFHWESHDVASRYCFIDYDREMAIVAEIEEGNERRLLGVGRLVADPAHERGEYAVLVSDRWQNQGLGSLLTDTCINIAKDWGLKTLFAQTTSDNPRMIAVFKKRDFTVEFDTDSSLVEVQRPL